MSLRRKLLIVFGGLAVLSLLISGVSLWATWRWEATAEQIDVHYRRSLLLQRVRAATYQALKEVEDGLTGDAVDARADFDQALAPAARDFAQWTALADTPAERAEVARVRAAYVSLTGNALRVFQLLENGRRTQAVQLVDDELDTNDLEQFRLLTEQGVTADQRRRADIREEVSRVRTTSQALLLVAVLSTISLALLFAAYLAQDLFRPLRELEAALRDLAAGDAKRRLEAGRPDEFGAVAKAFNAVAAAHAGGGPEPAPTVPLNLDLKRTDVRRLLHAVLERRQEALIDRAISLELRLDPAIPHLFLDRVQVREILSELVDNALAALPDRGGTLGLRLRREADGRALLEVADDGVGMEPDLIERAVGRDPFELGGEDRLGLPLARAVMKRHGGALEIFSRPGQGTVVQLAFPPCRNGGDDA